jgi:Fe-Mn family superoxide dismutase
MSIQLPPLPYENNALEPYVSAETLHFHHDKHHAKYVETTNELIQGTPYEKMELDEIVMKSAQFSFKAGKDRKIFNNASQAWNHAFLWKSMCPDSTALPTAVIKQLLEKNFGSIDSFRKQFQKSGMDLFGSGWTWLVASSNDSLSIMSTEKAGNPMTSGFKPLLCCDLWEHAYYLDYQNEKNKYMENFFKVVRWDFIEENLQKTAFSEAKENSFGGGMYPFML